MFGTLGLWDFGLSSTQFPAVTLGFQSFEPLGFGSLVVCPQLRCRLRHVFPSSQMAVTSMSLIARGSQTEHLMHGMRRQHRWRGWQGRSVQGGESCEIKCKARRFSWSWSTDQCYSARDLRPNLQIVTDFYRCVFQKSSVHVTFSQDPYTGPSTYGTCPEGNINTSEVLCPRPVRCADHGGVVEFGCFSCCFSESNIRFGRFEYA